MGSSFTFYYICVCVRMNMENEMKHNTVVNKYLIMHEVH